MALCKVCSKSASTGQALCPDCLGRYQSKASRGRPVNRDTRPEHDLTDLEKVMSVHQYRAEQQAKKGRKK